MSSTPSRWAWRIRSDRPLVARAFLSFVPWEDRYVCSVLVTGAVSHHGGDTPETALEAARYHVESTYGAVVDERPGQAGAEVRLARWNGGALLVSGEQCIGLLEEEVATLARGNGSQARGFVERRVFGRLTEKERAILGTWLTAGSWDRVPIDALFASLHPDFDYDPE